MDAGGRSGREDEKGERRAGGLTPRCCRISDAGLKCRRCEGGLRRPPANQRRTPGNVCQGGSQMSDLIGLGVPNAWNVQMLLIFDLFFGNF